MRFAISALACALLASSPALAGYPVDQTMKCPVGGQQFTFMTTGSYSTWGHRPDGKPYGSWEFPMQLPKCPNGLVVFDEFTKDEVGKLKSLIASDEYRAVSNTETNYFLAGWLMEKLGRPAIDVAWMIVQASWQADGRPEMKTRYQTMYIERIRSLPKSGDEVDWLAMQGRAVNGLRELGRFDEAKALLGSLSLTPLDVSIPEKKVVGSTASGLGQQISNYEEIEDAQRRRAFLGYFKDLGELIEARNADSEPLRMLPAREAVVKCVDPTLNLSSSDRAYCNSDQMKPAMALWAPKSN